MQILVYRDTDMCTYSSELQNKELIYSDVVFVNELAPLK